MIGRGWGHRWVLPLAFVLSLLAASCQQDSSSAPAGDPVASGGIGGTGKGTITSVTPATPASVGARPLSTLAAASVTLNLTHTFTLADTTEFLIDGNTGTAADLRNGLVARVDVDLEVNADFTGGTAVRVVAEHLLVGPVTGVGDALSVLGQPVLVTAQTVLDGVDPANLAVGDIVEVSGNLSAGGIVQATRLESAPGNLSAWRLTGAITSLPSGSRFLIGTQGVLLGGVSPTDCPSALAVGVKVKVSAAVDSGYVVGAPLPDLQATKIECVTPGIELPPGLSEGTLHVELEGFVTATPTITTDVPPLATFSVNGQMVQTNAQTKYEDGGLQDLVIGARVEVVGTLDVAQGVLNASRIEFSEQRVRIIAPVMDAGAHSLTLLGIPVTISPLTEIQDVTLLPCCPGSQVEVTGFSDGSMVFATEIKANSAATTDPVQLRGPVTLTGATTTFEVLGVTIDATGAVHLYDKSEQQVQDAATFVSGLQNGDQVNIKDGTFNAQTGTIVMADRIDFDD